MPRPQPTEKTFRYPWATNDYRTEFLESGTHALSLAIAMAIENKQVSSVPEVILPAYGCPDLVAAVLAQGAKPVLVDLLPDTAQLDDAQVRHAISPACVAVIAVGFLGIPERLDVLSEICRQHDIFLIEDAAQCFPPSGSNAALADAIVLSFGRGKPINLMGGGALIYRNDLQQHAKKVFDGVPFVHRSVGFVWKIKRLLFNWMMGRTPYWFVEKVPFLHIGETRFQECRGIRRAVMPAGLVAAGIREFYWRPCVSEEYRKALSDLRGSGWRFLKSDGMDPRRSKLRFAVLAPSSAVREEAELVLNRAGVGVSNFYGGILPELDGMEGLFDHKNFPVAKDFSSRLLTLPCHEDVRQSDIHKIARIMKELYLVEWPRGADRAS
ncbi:DegT/DnrJ/EryC1/StrS aminotransferase family protein [Marinobacter salinisoli]|uniref:DegT/DnrJ/EryC1/StrS aminotransferase family protein n=1 Tax=Marinobacter salinisoli TaxID=2769486 RepID=A0ABX7MNF7_9GAMM|nr:aminotransferase class V-fold PLP-dependent enzyme [Marinobacter salinisoli]QSP93683.1 DegT/DnrJ/EryC1/StrS aminotransferase family protein [Marinobacter salinisoli]